MQRFLRGVPDGIAFNQHFSGDGASIFKYGCALGCEGIVSKRLGSHYRSRRVEHWLKIKKPEAPAVPAPIFLALATLYAHTCPEERAGASVGAEIRRSPLLKLAL